MGLIITIGGSPGSGKSTIGRMLATRFGIPFFSMGEVRRQYALEHGMTLAELNARAEHDVTSDHLVDKFQEKLPEKYDSFIVDSRLGFHFLTQSIKIYIKVDRKVAAERIFPLRRDSEHWHTVEEGITALQARESSDKLRYMQYYGLDPADTSHYDIILDSTKTNPLEMLSQVVDFLKKRNVEVPEA